MTAAAALRALGVPAKTAESLANKPLEPIATFPEGLLATTSPAAGDPAGEKRR
jgi:hypothetical protein